MVIDTSMRARCQTTYNHVHALVGSQSDIYVPFQFAQQRRRLLAALSQHIFVPHISNKRIRPNCLSSQATRLHSGKHPIACAAPVGQLPTPTDP